MKIDNFIDCQICPSIQEQWLCCLELNQNFKNVLFFVEHVSSKVIIYSFIYLNIKNFQQNSYRTILELFWNHQNLCDNLQHTFDFFDFLKLRPQFRFHILQCVDHLLLYSSVINQFILLIDKHRLQSSARVQTVLISTRLL